MFNIEYPMSNNQLIGHSIFELYFLCALCSKISKTTFEYTNFICENP